MSEAVMNMVETQEALRLLRLERLNTGMELIRVQNELDQALQVIAVHARITTDMAVLLEHAKSLACDP